MNIFRKLLGQTDKFFDLLEAGAVEAHNSVKLLYSIIRDQELNPALDPVTQIRRKEKHITEEIGEELCKTFVTPLEREDIERLSVFLYKIPKTVEKFLEKYLLCRHQLRNVNFSGQISILEKAAGTVAEMVSNLRKHPGLEVMREQNDRLHQLEGEADKLMLKIVSGLYAGDKDSLAVIMTLDLCETLEDAIDRCRDAGNVVFQTVLKYS